MSYSSAIWRDNCGFTTAIICKSSSKEKNRSLMMSLKFDPYDRRVIAVVSIWCTSGGQSLCGLLAMQKLEFCVDQVIYMMQDVIYEQKDAKIILIPIVLHGPYHLLTFNLLNQKCVNYSPLISDVYDNDTVNIVSDSRILY